MFPVCPESLVDAVSTTLSGSPVRLMVMEAFWIGSNPCVEVTLIVRLPVYVELADSFCADKILELDIKTPYIFFINICGGIFYVIRKCCYVVVARQEFPARVIKLSD